MFCSNCGSQNEASARFCLSCGQPVAASGAAAPPLRADPRMRGVSVAAVAVAQKRYAREKSPVVALVLSLLLAGVGQFYNGDAKKGALMLVVALVGAVVTAGFGYFAVMLWSVFDAYQVASGKSPLW